MVRVLFSALSARQGGGLTYIRNVVREFPRGQGDALTILSPSPIDGLPDHPDVEWEKAPAWTQRPITRILFGAVYFRFLWSRRRSFDVVYYAGGSFDIALPREVKTAVAFRNMLPFDPKARRRYPLGWQRFRHWLLEFVQLHAFRRADLVIFISQYAQQVIDRLAPRRRGASVVIPHGTTPTEGTLDGAIADQLPPRFVLYLSVLDVYKAQLELVEAWALLKSRSNSDAKLILAGSANGPYADRVRQAIARLDLHDEVVLLGKVRYDQVSDLCRRAEFNVFLSSCENCPNILLELMAIGTPMLVSSYQPMPELGGEGLDYVDPYDVTSLADSLERLLGDPARRDRLANAALDRSRLYTWEKTGRDTWNAILSHGAR